MSGPSSPSLTLFGKGLRQRRQTNSIAPRRPTKAAARCKLDSVILAGISTLLHHIGV
jgi:hypothetical protein